MCSAIERRMHLLCLRRKVLRYTNSGSLVFLMMWLPVLCSCAFLSDTSLLLLDVEVEKCEVLVPSLSLVLSPRPLNVDGVGDVHVVYRWHMGLLITNLNMFICGISTNILMLGTPRTTLHRFIR